MVLRTSLCLLVLVIGLAPAYAQAPADTLRPVPLPGGYFVLEALGIRADVPRAQLVPQAIRLLHQAPDGTQPRVDEQREDLVRVFKVLHRLRNAAADRTAGIALEDASNPALRAGFREDLESLGLELSERRGVFAIRLATGAAADIRAALLRAGIDVARIFEGLANGERRQIGVPSVTVPFPLPTAVWEKLLERRVITDHDLLPLVLENRRASLFAYGLLAMDPVSRGWLISSEETLRAAWEHSASFATMARSIVVRDGTLVLPGGTEAGRSWERVAGAKVARPTQLVRHLLSRSDGRLAYFFDTLAQLDPPHLQFVLTPTPQRREPLQALYGVMAVADSNWNHSERPFSRAQIDTPVVLRVLDVDASGVLTGPSSRALWEAVVSGVSISPKTATATWLERQGNIDAVWIATLVSNAKPRDRADLLQRLAFAQRVFARAEVTESADLIFVLGHHATYRTLLMTLERMGLTSPATYAAGVRAAIVAGSMDVDKRTLALTELQGAVALVERLRSAGAIAAKEADAAVAALFQLPLDDDRLYQGRVAEWLATHMVPLWRRVGASAGEQDTVVLLRALGGERAAGLRTFEWESERYVPSLTAVQLARLETGMRRSVGGSVGDVIALWRQIERTQAATSIEDLQRATADLGTGVEKAHVLPVGISPDDAKDLSNDARKGVRELLEIRKTSDLDKVRGRLKPVLKLVERLSADSLRTMAYLAAMPMDDLASVPDLALRHDFGLVVAGQTDDAQTAAPWQVPRFSEDGGVRIVGSLLALDAANARAALRRLQSNAIPPPPTVSPATMATLSHTLLLADIGRVSDASRDAIAATIRRGRERIAAAAASPSPSAALPWPSGMSQWRVATLDWTATHAPKEFEAQFTLREIYELGTPGAIDADGWGVSQQLFTGCPCTRMRGVTAPETLAGRLGSAEPGAHFTDLTLRLAEALERDRLPTVLLPLLLALATQDVIDRTAAVETDDMMAVSRAVAGLSRERIADYVAAIVGRGFARPVERVEAAR